MHKLINYYLYWYKKASKNKCLILSENPKWPRNKVRFQSLYCSRYLWTAFCEIRNFIKCFKCGHVLPKKMLSNEMTMSNYITKNLFEILDIINYFIKTWAYLLVCMGRLSSWSHLIPCLTLTPLLSNNINLPVCYEQTIPT